MKCDRHKIDAPSDARDECPFCVAEAYADEAYATRSTPNRPATFSHAGKHGDVIYALPTIRALGGGLLYLSPSDKLGDFCFTQAHVEFLRPLLVGQCGVTDVQLHHGRTVAYDLNCFKHGPHWRYGMNLVDLHLAAFGLPHGGVPAPWLKVIPVRSAKVLFNRTRRYRNRHFPWRAAYEKYKDDCAFIGDDLGHWEFEADIGRIARIRCTTALELAQVIAGSDLLVGSQSFPLSLAIALGKACVHEICLTLPNCNFGRSNEWATGGGSLRLPEI